MRGSHRTGSPGEPWGARATSLKPPAIPCRPGPPSELAALCWLCPAASYSRFPCGLVGLRWPCCRRLGSQGVRSPFCG